MATRQAMKAGMDCEFWDNFREKESYILSMTEEELKLDCKEKLKLTFSAIHREEIQREDELKWSKSTNKNYPLNRKLRLAQKEAESKHMAEQRRD